VKTFVATQNSGKLRELRTIFSGSSLALAKPRKYAAAVEDADTYAGNALLKARALAATLQKRGIEGMVLADDSGLEVDALQGAPGVRSARYAADAGFRADGSTDDNNNLFLLQQLARVPDSERGARYQCVLAAARDGGVLLSAQGTVEGRILSAPRGSNGFGYDPLFYLPARACTMAEMDDQTKWTLSHRGHAFRALLELLG